METFEKTLQDFDKKTKEHLESHKLYLANSITKLADKGHEHNHRIDKLFSDQFNKDICNLKKEIVTPFNPKHVIEFDGELPIQIIDTWDKHNGILPNIQFMSECSTFSGNKYKKTIFCPKGKGHTLVCMHCGSDSYLNDSYTKCNNRGNISNVRCVDMHIKDFKLKCDTCNGYGYTLQEIYKNNMIKNIEFTVNQRFDFKIDNYLNLYCPQYDVYLMFNKIPFPDICFILRPEVYLNRFYDYGVLVEDMNTMSTFSASKAIDFSTVCSTVKKFIPPNFADITDIYSKIRNTLKYEEKDTEETEDVDSFKPLDSKDRIIESLNIKLKFASERTVSLSKTIDEIKNLYNETSLSLKDITREYENEKAKNSTDEKIEILNLKNEIFRLTEELGRIKESSIKEAIVSDTLESEKTKYSLLEREFSRLKDKNSVLSSQILSMSKDIDKLREENNDMTHNIIDKTGQLTEDETIIFSLQQSVKNRDEKIEYLQNILLKKESSDSSGLEEALKIRIDELTEQVTNEKLKTAQLEKNNTYLENEIKKIKSVLASIK